MGARLVSLDGEADIPLDRVPTLVGRHPSCDARIDSARISRRHCCLAPDGAGVGVRDLGSTNGTRINGHRVESGRLGAGDELAIAQFRYRLVVGESRAEQADAAGQAPAPAGGAGLIDVDSILRSRDSLPGTILADPDRPGGPGPG